MRRDGSVPNTVQIASLRRFLWAQITLFPLLPVFAAAMARGYGQFA